MRPAKVVIDVREGQLVAQALFAFTEGDHAPSDGGYMLADGEVDALNEAVLICQPWAASMCCTAARVWNTTRCLTRTIRRRR